jgi:hypothetical protein
MPGKCSRPKLNSSHARKLRLLFALAARNISVCVDVIHLTGDPRHISHYGAVIARRRGQGRGIASYFARDAMAGRFRAIAPHYEVVTNGLLEELLALQ